MMFEKMIVGTYSTILRFYPTRFKNDFAEEMVDVFTERLQDKIEGRFDYVRFVVRDLWSLILTSIRVYKDNIIRVTKRINLPDLHGIDPRVIGSVLVAIGFGFSQLVLFFLHKEDSNLISMLGNYFMPGFVVLTACESTVLAVSIFVLFKSNIRRDRGLAVLALWIAYFVGSTIIVKFIPILNQQFNYPRRLIVIDFTGMLDAINTTQKAFWILVRFLGDGITGFIFGSLLEAASERNRFSIRTPLHFMSVVAIADLLAYCVYLFSLILLGMKIGGPFPLPDHLYAQAIFGLVKGLMIGFALGNRSLRLPKWQPNQPIELSL